MKISSAEKRKKNGVVKVLASSMMLLALVACGEKKGASQGQMVARVDGQEITIHQLNNELSKGGGSEVTKQLLDGLVARQLLLNAARKDKLDSDPAVLADLERARDLVLVQSYVRGKLGSPTRPTSQSVEDFYKKNPDWFAQRKQFEFAQLIIATTSLTPELNDLMGQSKPIEEIATWLGQHHIQFTRQQVIKTSMDLPPDMLASLKTMDRGRLFIVKEGPSSILTALQDVKNVPLSLGVAASQIEQFLLSQQQSRATEDLVARLKKDSTIEYSDQAKSFKDLAARTPEMSGASGTNDKAKGSAQTDAVARGVAGFK